MDSLIHISLCAPERSGKKVRLSYRPLPTVTGARYLKAIKHCLQENIPLIETDRFHGFSGDPRDKTWIAGQINDTIGAINDIGNATLIPLKAEPEMSQEQMQKALDDFNLLIHRYEAFVRNEAWVRAGNPSRARAVLKFDNIRPRYPLTIEDYNAFEPRQVFGMLYVNYCEVGKSIGDVFLDGDKVDRATGIRPMRYLSADGYLYFGPSTSPEIEAAMVDRFEGWWKANSRQLADLGFERNDPLNALGLLPVAMLDRKESGFLEMSDEEIRQHIAEYQTFHSVSLS
jgi:hypothetical protein